MSKFDYSQGSFPDEVTGEMAKIILAEIQRPPTRSEIEHLKRAMKNRFPRKKRMPKVGKILD